VPTLIPSLCDRANWRFSTFKPPCLRDGANCKIRPRLLLITNGKSLAYDECMTLDDIGRPLHTLLHSIIHVFIGTHRENFDEDLPALSAATKMQPRDSTRVVSDSVWLVRLFARVHWRGSVKQEYLLHSPYSRQI